MKRLGFAPFVEGLDNLIEGGVPEGSWLSIFGPPGGFKTLHSLAFCLAGVIKGEKCVYVSTEMDRAQLKGQLDSLEWKMDDVYEVLFTSKITENEDYGSFDLVWVDLDSLRYWAYKLNALFREEKKKSKDERKKIKWFWYNDPSLLMHVIMIALGGVGVLERTVKDITLEEVLYARVKDGLYGKSKYTRFTVNKDVSARVIIDSISPFVIGKYAVAGQIMTDMKVRLVAPNVTYIIISHVAKTTEDELGASIGHITDGRIKLWMDLDMKAEIAKHYGWIVKMRMTDHSRRLHRVSIEGTDIKKIVWK